MRNAITIGALLLLPACAALPSTTVAPRSSRGLADADSLRIAELVPGVTHVFAWYRQGPWAAHIIEIDQARCRPELVARKPGPPLSARARTSVLSADALAGINADFFMLPGGTTVGAHVSGGVPLIGPTDRQVFALSGGDWWIGIARLDGAVAHRADSAQLVQINRPDSTFTAYRGTVDGVTLFTSWAGDSIVVSRAAWRARLRLLEGDERSGRAVITALENTPIVRMRTGEVLLTAHGNGSAWARRRNVGDTVSWRARVPLPTRAGTVAAQEVVGGFPELLRAGEEVLGTQTVVASFGQQRHPRSAIGWTSDRARLFLVLVDGRQAPYSAGMSLPELTWLFQRMGASDALNLDGGGSSALVIRGAAVNRVSDRQNNQPVERAVGNALVLKGCTR